jgi:hypothetical protein
MDLSPEQQLILALIRQAMRDYIKLDPDSWTLSAEFFESEGQDFKTAEDFLYKSEPIKFGSLNLTYADCCDIVGIDAKKLKKIIAEQSKEY